MGDSDSAFYQLITNAEELESCKNINRRITLFDVAKACNYQSTIISFRNDWVGFWPVTATIGRTADNCFYLGKRDFPGQNLSSLLLDTELPGYLRKPYKEKAVHPQRSFVVVCPFGTHQGMINPPKNFCEKYAKHSTYEKGLLFFDKQLGNIFAELKAHPETKAILYCSDHSYFRDDDKRIVMFVYLADSLIKERPGIRVELRKKAKEKIYANGIYDLMLWLMNISEREKSPNNRGSTGI